MLHFGRRRCHLCVCEDSSLFGFLTQLDVSLARRFVTGPAVHPSPTGGHHRSSWSFRSVCECLSGALPPLLLVNASVRSPTPGRWSIGRQRRAVVSPPAFCPPHRHPEACYASLPCGGGVSAASSGRSSARFGEDKTSFSTPRTTPFQAATKRQLVLEI